MDASSIAEMALAQTAAVAITAAVALFIRNMDREIGERLRMLLFMLSKLACGALIGCLIYPLAIKPQASGIDALLIACGVALVAALVAWSPRFKNR